MNTKRIVTILTVFLSICILYNLSSCIGDKTDKSHNSNTKQVKTGKDLYKTHCISCHGADGSLGISGAKNLKESRLTNDEVVLQIKKGKGMMTGFEDRLSDAEIVLITEYIFQLRTP